MSPDLSDQEAANLAWNLSRADNADRLAREARATGNAAMGALWELYAKQYRARGTSY